MRGRHKKKQVSRYPTVLPRMAGRTGDSSLMEEAVFSSWCRGGSLIAAAHEPLRELGLSLGKQSDPGVSD